MMKLTKKMKHRLPAVLALILLFSLVQNLALPLQASDEPGGDPAQTEDAVIEGLGPELEGTGWVEAASNDEAMLSINLETTEISVASTDGETVWYSNPQDRADDEIANGANKQRLGAQLMLTYYTPNSMQIQADNYIDAILNGQFTIHEVEDGVRVNYIIGEAPSEYIHPLAISADRYEAVFEAAGADGQRVLNRRYTERVLEDLKPADRETLLELYPGLADQPFYILRDGINDFILEQISEIFESTGYTYEDKVADEAEAGIEAPEEELLNVEVLMQCILN